MEKRIDGLEQQLIELKKLDHLSQQVLQWQTSQTMFAPE